MLHVRVTFYDEERALHCIEIETRHVMYINQKNETKMKLLAARYYFSPTSPPLFFSLGGIQLGGLCLRCLFAAAAALYCAFKLP